MVLAAYGYVEERGSGSQSTSRPWPVTSSEWSGHGWTRCWSGRLPWRPLPPLHEATGAVASPLMPTRTGSPQLPHRPQHKPRPEQTNPSRLTALTPQNQPERPLLRGNQDWLSTSTQGFQQVDTAPYPVASRRHLPLRSDSSAPVCAGLRRSKRKFGGKELVPRKGILASYE